MIESPTAKNRLRTRLQAAAREECDAVFKVVKTQCQQLKDIELRFEDTPDSKMLAAGVPPEAVSTVRAGEIVLFLFNIYQAGKNAADFREGVRRALLTEIGDLIGEEVVEQG